MPEWLKGTDCKSVGYAYVGSNPTPSTIQRPQGTPNDDRAGRRVSEPKKAFEFRRVWLNGRATAFQADDEGSIPFTRSSLTAKPEMNRVAYGESRK